MKETKKDIKKEGVTELNGGYLQVILKKEEMVTLDIIRKRDSIFKLYNILKQYFEGSK